MMYDCRDLQFFIDVKVTCEYTSIPIELEMIMSLNMCGLWTPNGAH